jgi:hypothetical protein
VYLVLLGGSMRFFGRKGKSTRATARVLVEDDSARTRFLRSPTPRETNVLGSGSLRTRWRPKPEAGTVLRDTRFARITQSLRSYVYHTFLILSSTFYECYRNQVLTERLNENRSLYALRSRNGRYNAPKVGRQPILRLYS